MFCPQCGKEILEGAVFCSSCGAALGADQSPGADDATNPFAVGAQTSNTSGVYDSTAPDVPTGPFSAFKICFKKYNKLKGRASRTEYWYWLLFTFLTVAIPYGIGVALILIDERNHNGGEALPIIGVILAMAAVVWGLVCLCPGLHMMVRRMHDVNLSGWCFLFLMLPYVNLIFALVLAFVPGTRGPNKFGPQPARRRTPESSGTSL